jgi:Raf kinase inhibitor-like YbhB/YbcL family protein
MREKRLTVECPSFGTRASIPPRHTCEGDGVSPKIRWRDLPEGTKSFVLIMEDLDVPAPRLCLFTWVRGAACGIPPQVTTLREGVRATPRLENGAKQAVTSFRRPGYGDPCPAWGTHRYRFRLYALGRRLDLEPKGVRKRDLVQAMRGHILATGDLVGVARRRKHAPKRPHAEVGVRAV